jgi:DNA-binding CsgD family transcriptional regulator|tara:strand:+ start:706 stop:1464 length:759 start_codon:yes stop_codon:yes gene_type:complete
MVGPRSLQNQESLALATSLIHRSRSVDDLQRAFFFIAPRFVHADAYGMYLFDDKLNTESIFSYQTHQHFLNQYETLRDSDPLFNRLLQKKTFTHSLDIFEAREWFRQPLHDFLSQWGLDYSIEAPLVIDGRVRGTLNIARSGRKYFERNSLASAQFLCKEINAAFERITEIEVLKKELALVRNPLIRVDELSGRTHEVLKLAAIGLSNLVISSRLGVSENTVRYHLKQIYRVLDVHNRAQLVQRLYSTVKTH